MLTVAGLTFTAVAQAPKKFNYQAVVRNSAGDPVPSGTTVSFRFGLSQNRAFGTLLYQETQQKTTSNNTGLVNMEIGGGNKTFGNFPTHSQLAADSLFLKVEMDPSGGSTYFEIAVVQLNAVPYAIYASGAGHADDAWALAGNSAIDSNNHYIGTSDAKGFALRTNNTNRIKITSTGMVGIGTNTPNYRLTVAGDALVNNIVAGRGAGNISTNTAFGMSNLTNNTTGHSNSAFGYMSLAYSSTGTGNSALGREALRNNTTGHENVGIGTNSMYSNSLGSHNVAIGYNSLYSNNLGFGNVAIGYAALQRSTNRHNLVAVGDSALYNNGFGATGSQALQNTAVGSKSLFSNTTGGYNSAFGYSSLIDNTSGNYNSAFGVNSLGNNTTGFSNSAFGYIALALNTTGQYNSAFGVQSLNRNTTGSNNSAFGLNSLFYNTTGNTNVGAGNSSLFNNTTGDGNTAVGFNALYNNTTGEYNVGLGYNASVSVTNRYSAAIGANSTSSAMRTMAFGRADSVLHWVFGRTACSSTGYAFQVGSSTANGNSAYLTSGGAWTNTSDVNLKTDITPINGSDLLARIKQLEITRWRYTGTNEYHIGPMAQQFYQLFRTGVDDKGISTVDPAGIALRGIQEQQKQIEALKTENEQLKQAIEELRQLIKQKPAISQ